MISTSSSTPTHVVRFALVLFVSLGLATPLAAEDPECDPCQGGSPDPCCGQGACCKWNGTPLPGHQCGPFLASNEPDGGCGCEPENCTDITVVPSPSTITWDKENCRWTEVMLQVKCGNKVVAPSEEVGGMMAVVACEDYDDEHIDDCVPFDWCAECIISCDPSDVTYYVSMSRFIGGVRTAAKDGLFAHRSGKQGPFNTLPDESDILPAGYITATNKATEHAAFQAASGGEIGKLTIEVQIGQVWAQRDEPFGGTTVAWGFIEEQKQTITISIEAPDNAGPSGGGGAPGGGGGGCTSCTSGSGTGGHRRAPTPALTYAPSDGGGRLAFHAGFGELAARGGVLQFISGDNPTGRMFVPGYGEMSSQWINAKGGLWSYTHSWGDPADYTTFLAVMTDKDGVQYEYMTTNGLAESEEDWSGAFIPLSRILNPRGSTRAAFESEDISTNGIAAYRVTAQIDTNGIAALEYEYDVNEPSRLTGVFVSHESGPGDGFGLNLEYDDYYRLTSYSYSGCSACGETVSVEYAPYDPANPYEQRITKRTVGPSGDQLSYEYGYDEYDRLIEVTRSWTDGSQTESQRLWEMVPITTNGPQVNGDEINEYWAYVDPSDYERIRLETNDGVEIQSQWTGLSGSGTEVKSRLYSDEDCPAGLDCVVQEYGWDESGFLFGRRAYFDSNGAHELTKEARWDGSTDEVVTEYSYQTIDYIKYLGSVTNPYGGVTVYNRHSTGPNKTRLMWQKDPAFGDYGATSGKQYQVEYTYTDNGQIDIEKRKTVEDEWRQTKYAYNSAGQVETMTEDWCDGCPNLLKTFYEYDAFGHVTQITDPRGVITHWEYTPLGRLTREYTMEWSETGGAGDNAVAEARYYYDVHGRLVLERRADDEGMFGPGSPSAWFDTGYVYDHFGRRIKVIENPDVSIDGNEATVSIGTGSRVTEYEYDYQDRVTKTIHPDGSWTAIVRDGRGLVIGEATGYGETTYLETTYEHDSAGNRTRVTTPSGTVKDYTYDDFGRLETVVEGYLTTTHVYDDHGQPIQVERAYDDLTTNGVIDEIWKEYDPLGRVWREVRKAADGEESVTTSDRVTLTTYTIPGMVEIVGQKGPGKTAFDIESGDRATVHEYDDLDRLTAQTVQNGPYGAVLSRTEYEHDASGNVTLESVLVEGTEYLDTETTCDALGRAVTVTDPEGRYIETVYDSLGRRVTQIAYEAGQGGPDVAKSRQAWVYDDLGQVEVAVTYADASTGGTPDRTEDRVVDYTYDAGGRVETIKTYNGNTATPLTTTYEYDDIGRRTKVTDPDGNTQEWIYATTGADIGLVTERRVDDGSVEHGLRVFSYEYDSRDRMITETAEGEDPAPDLVTSYGYDAAGRRTKVTDAEGKETVYTYDMLGDRVRMTETGTQEGQEDLVRETDFVFDRLGRLKHLIAYDGNRPEGGVDPEDPPDHVQVTTYEYDLAGRRTQIAYPDSGGAGDVVTYVYDLAGRMTSRTDQREITTTYDYDKRGLLTSRSATQGSVTTSDVFAYDGVGRMVSAIRTVGGDDVSSNGFQYDDLSNLTRESQVLLDCSSAFEVDYAYDQAGNRTKLVHPGDDIELHYTHDSLNRVVTIKRKRVGTDANPVALVEYDYEGTNLTRRRVTTTYAGDCNVYLDLALGYDEHRRNDEIDNLVSPPTGTPLSVAEYDYTFDKVGNRTSQTTSGWYKSVVSSVDPLLRDLDYTYDGLHRLTQATYGSLTGDPYEQFQYDLLGNRDGAAGYTDTRPEPDLIIAYGDNNQANEYADINSHGLLYDAAGNLTLDETGTGYAYDFENKVVTVFDDADSDGTLDGGETVMAQYAYDALGRRVRFINYFDQSGIYGTGATTVTTRFVYDGQNVIEEYDDDDQAPVRQRYYVHGPLYIDERVLIHDDDAPNEGAAATDYYYLLKDLYTVVGLVNKAGQSVERYVYDAYGKALVVETNPVDVNHDGQATGLDLAVLQDPGRWLQEACDVGTVYDLNGDGWITGLDLGKIQSPPIWNQDVNVVIPASSVGNPYLFTGRRLDFVAKSGDDGPEPVYYYRARSYDPDNGRFMQRDPVDYSPWMNLYEYVVSCPTQSSDPRGLSLIDFIDPFPPEPDPTPPLPPPWEPEPEPLHFYPDISPDGVYCPPCRWEPSGSAFWMPVETSFARPKWLEVPVPHPEGSMQTPVLVDDWFVTISDDDRDPSKYLFLSAGMPCRVKWKAVQECEEVCGPYAEVKNTDMRICPFEIRTTRGKTIVDTWGPFGGLSCDAPEPDDKPESSDCCSGKSAP